MITRFAPSPTGPLHLGHAFAAILAHDMARAAGGRFLLRIEDIDRGRCRPDWITGIIADLRWLGLSWDGPVLHQSTRLPAYRAALADLWARRLLYPCSCNRRDILDAARAPQEGAPAMGPDGIVYPGTCRGRPRDGAMPDGALRLDIAAAMALTGSLAWVDGTAPQHATPKAMITGVGDVVLARRDMGTSYHLAVVLDDAHQSVTDVTRGEDLRDATAIHVLLQRLLGLPTPRYHHHRLIRDGSGRRLAKRDDARAIARYREDGASPAEIRAMIGITPAAAP